MWQRYSSGSVLVVGVSFVGTRKQVQKQVDTIQSTDQPRPDARCRNRLTNSRQAETRSADTQPLDVRQDGTVEEHTVASLKLIRAAAPPSERLNCSFLRKRPTMSNRSSGHASSDSIAPARVAYQGEPGAYSECAVIELLGEGVEAVGLESFEAVFRSTVEKHTDLSLVPVENSLGGR